MGLETRPQQGAEPISSSRAKQAEAVATLGEAGTSSATKQQQPQIIECRKKDSRGESVVTNRYYKGKLLGKVRERGMKFCLPRHLFNTDPELLFFARYIRAAPSALRDVSERLHEIVRQH